MGTTEVYDSQRQKWVKYESDYDKVYQHFKDLRDGNVQPDPMGRYIIGSGKENRKLKELEAQLKETRDKLRESENKLDKIERPVVNMVSPVTQALEMAKSELERESNGAYLEPRRKKRRTDMDWDQFEY